MSHRLWLKGKSLSLVILDNKERKRGLSNYNLIFTVFLVIRKIFARGPSDRPSQIFFSDLVEALPIGRDKSVLNSIRLPDMPHGIQQRITNKGVNINYICQPFPISFFFDHEYLLHHYLINHHIHLQV